MRKLIKPLTLPQRFSGAFNTILAPGNPGLPCKDLRITSWNCRALFCRKHKRKWAKIAKVAKIAEYSDIILLQETHGDEYIMDLLLSSLKKNFWIYGSFYNCGTGGVITAVRKSHTPNENSILHESFAPGRVTRTSISGLQSTLVIWNNHNFDISYTNMRKIATQLKSDSESAAANPTGFLAFAIGDLNFERPDFKRVACYTPTSIQNTTDPATKLPRAGQASFESALAGFVEAVTALELE